MVLVLLLLGGVGSAATGSHWGLATFSSLSLVHGVATVLFAGSFLASLRSVLDLLLFSIASSLKAGVLPAWYTTTAVFADD